jgi:hypothetical protein
MREVSRDRSRNECEGEAGDTYRRSAARRAPTTVNSAETLLPGLSLRRRAPPYSFGDSASPLFFASDVPPPADAVASFRAAKRCIQRMRIVRAGLPPQADVHGVEQTSPAIPDRFLAPACLRGPGTHRERRMADPYWGASMSRRWGLFERGPVQGYFGFGLAGTIGRWSPPLRISRESLCHEQHRLAARAARCSA